MDNAFDFLGIVSPGRESWRFKVRVLRLWKVYSFMKPEQLNSVEMVLIDEKGAKIHASIRRQLLYLFTSKITEGNVYKMSHFAVCPESGLYRTTPHPYKLIFEMKTKVQMCESNTIDRYGLSLTTIGDVCGHGPNHDFLVDVAALVTGISAEREYIRDGRVTKMVVLEIADNSGKCECALFGSYVDELSTLLGRSGGGLPVIVIQFAKIKTFRGNVSIQNVLNATRIYVNPSIPEIVSFKESLAVDGVEIGSSIPIIGPHAKPSLEDEFLVNYPKTSIGNLLESDEDGIYIVCGVVVGLVDAEDWWYAACGCHRSVTPDSGAYYCKQCVKHVFKMVPRFRVKVTVDDGHDQAIFVVFDGDMNTLLGKHCHELVASSKGQNDGYYPPELELLKGSKLLFKVEKSSRISSIQFDGSFRVKRVCNDLSVIESFDLAFAPQESGTDDEDGENSDGIEDEEFVQNTSVEDFVDHVVVSPSSVLDRKDSDVSTEVINLEDNSDNGLEVFLPPRVDWDGDKISSAKRNLLDAFDGCEDGGASASKTKKKSQG